MTISQPEVAIVILNYNGQTYLERFLPFVLASTYASKRVIVADNASTDGSVAFVQNNYPSVELLLLPENYGFAGGYNKALQQVQSEYYVLLNSDVEVTPGWIEPVISFLQEQPAYAVCQPKILAYNEKDHFEYAGASGGWIDYLGYPFARGRAFTTLEKDAGQYNENAPVFWASGAAMFIRSAVYHAAGGLDEYFFAHQEEIDLCWRIQLAGHQIGCIPASVVYHVGGGTLPKGHRKTFLNFRNNLVMLLKNLRFAEKCWKIPVRLLLDHVFSFKCLLTGDVQSFKAIVQAHVAVIQWQCRKKEKPAQQPKPMTDLSGVLYKSLVLVYFVQGKKRFTEIIGRKGR